MHESSTPSRRANGIIAALILGAMCLMALVTLQYALTTVNDRRENDRQRTIVDTISVPWLARAALGAYVLVIVGTLIRGCRRHEGDGESVSSESWISNRVVPFTAVALVIGIGLLLLSIQQRPARQPKPSNQAALAPLPPKAPKQLAALGFLPPGANFVAGIHVAELLQSPTTRDLFSPESEGLSLAALESWTGLRLAEIDHAVVGVRIEDTLVPSVNWIFRTRRPMDSDEVIRKLKATVLRRREGRDVFRFKPENTRLDVHAWQPDNQTLAVVINPADIDRIPVALRPAQEQFFTSLSNDINGLPLSTPIWAIGHVADWDKTLMGALSKEGRREWPVLSRTRSGRAWMQVSDIVQFHLAVECIDTDAAASLVTELSKAKLAHSPIGAEIANAFGKNSLWKAWSESATVSQEGARVIIRADADFASIKPTAKDR